MEAFCLALLLSNEGNPYNVKFEVYIKPGTNPNKLRNILSNFTVIRKWVCNKKIVS